MNDHLPGTLKALLICGCIILFASCVNTKRVTYFNDIQSGTFPVHEAEPAIQVNDLLSITVTSLNPEATEVFNTPNQSVIAASSGTGVSAITTGYLVDAQGNITFPILGAVKAEGLTVKQLTDKLASTLASQKLLVDPIVNIRMMNFRVTVLGEVARPSVVSVPNGRITLLEALGMAGDLTIFAKRDNVLLIRIENGQKTVQRINLNDPAFVSNSPYYFLKTNDVIYVEPGKSKVASTSTFRQTLPAILSGLSFLAIIVDRATR